MSLRINDIAPDFAAETTEGPIRLDHMDDRTEPPDELIDHLALAERGGGGEHVGQFAQVPRPVMAAQPQPGGGRDLCPAAQQPFGQPVEIGAFAQGRQGQGRPRQDRKSVV